MSNESEADDEPVTDAEVEESTTAADAATEPDADEDAETEETESDSDAEVEDAEEEADAAEADGEEAEAADAEEADAGVGDGDFVRIDYTARTVEDGRLVDTTDPDVAADEGVDQDPEDFSARTIVLGEGHIFASVEDDIRGKEVGDSGSVTVPAGEAFGEFDEEQVRTVSKEKIPEDDRYPGAQVRIDGEEGFVETIIGGRARVDFNHPLAGEDIEYEYELVGTVEDREEQAHGLLEMFLGLDLEIWFETDTVEEERLVEEDADEDDEDAAEVEGDEDADEADDESDAEDSEGEADDEEVADTEAEDGEEDGDEGPTYETVEVEKESLYVEATPQLTMNQQWMFQKQQICDNLIELIGVDRVVIQEIIESTPMGMGGMMGGGMGGGLEGLEEALEDADIDADELAEELE